MDETRYDAACVEIDASGVSLRASIDLAAPAERVFDAITSEITDWWVRPGVFDTREFVADLRPGGRWRATGFSRGQPYVAEGEIVEVDRPRRFVHSWDGIGALCTLTYVLEPRDHETRLKLEQRGFASHKACTEFAAGWETSFARLADVLAAEAANA